MASFQDLQAIPVKQTADQSFVMTEPGAYASVKHDDKSKCCEGEKQQAAT